MSNKYFTELKSEKKNAEVIRRRIPIKEQNVFYLILLIFEGENKNLHNITNFLLCKSKRSKHQRIYFKNSYVWVEYLQ